MFVIGAQNIVFIIFLFLNCDLLIICHRKHQILGTRNYTTTCMLILWLLQTNGLQLHFTSMQMAQGAQWELL